jgi:hypothetical protein
MKKKTAHDIFTSFLPVLCFYNIMEALTWKGSVVQFVELNVCLILFAVGFWAFLVFICAPISDAYSGSRLEGFFNQDAGDFLVKVFGDKSRPHPFKKEF